MIPVARNVWQHVEGGSPRGRGAPLDHRQDDPPLERPARQPAPRRVHALEEHRLRLLEPGRLDGQDSGSLSRYLFRISDIKCSSIRHAMACEPTRRPSSMFRS